MTESVLLELRPDDIPFGTDGLNAPTYYADFIRGSLVASGIIKVNFVANRLDAISEDVKSVHVVTIVTPLEQIRAWAHFLNEIADRHGVAPLVFEEPEAGPEAEAAPEAEANGAA